MQCFYVWLLVALMAPIPGTFATGVESLALHDGFVAAAGNCGYLSHMTAFLFYGRISEGVVANMSYGVRASAFWSNTLDTWVASKRGQRNSIQTVRSFEPFKTDEFPVDKYAVRVKEFGKDLFILDENYKFLVAANSQLDTLTYSVQLPNGDRAQDIASNGTHYVATTGIDLTGSFTIWKRRSTGPWQKFQVPGMRRVSQVCWSPTSNRWMIAGDHTDQTTSRSILYSAADIDGEWKVERNETQENGPAWATSITCVGDAADTIIVTYWSSVHIKHQGVWNIWSPVAQEPQVYEHHLLSSAVDMAGEYKFAVGGESDGTSNPEGIRIWVSKDAVTWTDFSPL